MPVDVKQERVRATFSHIPNCLRIELKLLATFGNLVANGLFPFPSSPFIYLCVSPAHCGCSWSRRDGRYGRYGRGYNWLPRGAGSMSNLVVIKQMIPSEIRLSLNA